MNENARLAQVLCRNLKENPNVAGNMLKIQTERMQLQTLLSTAIVELEDCAHDTLNTTVHDEESRERAVASTLEREKAATAAVKQLKVQLKEEKASHDDDMAQKKKVLTVLKDQLKGLKTTYVPTHLIPIRTSSPFRLPSSLLTRSPRRWSLKQRLCRHDRIMPAPSGRRGTGGQSS